MVSLAVLYVLLGAEFIAAAQLVVYSGAIMVLFVFVIMLLNIREEESKTDRQKYLKFLAAPLFLALLGMIAAVVKTVGNPAPRGTDQLGSVQTLAEGMFTKYVLPFEATSVLILMATGEDKGKARPDAASKARNLATGHILMVGAGFWGGFIQIGVGFLMMPILYRVMGLDLVRTNMHKVFIALVFSFVALWVFASKAPIAWEAGAALAAGNAVGGWMGAHATMTRGEKFIKRALFAVLAAMAVKLVFFP